MKSVQIIAILGAVFAFGLWYAVIVFGEPMVLQSLVSPAPGVDIQVWLDEFMRSQVFAVAIACILALTWHATSFQCSADGVTDAFGGQ